jgi:hypothetical protein
MKPPGSPTAASPAATPAAARAETEKFQKKLDEGQQLQAQARKFLVKAQKNGGLSAENKGKIEKAMADHKKAHDHIKAKLQAGGVPTQEEFDKLERMHDVLKKKELSGQENLLKDRRQRIEETGGLSAGQTAASVVGMMGTGLGVSLATQIQAQGAIAAGSIVATTAAAASFAETANKTFLDGLQKAASNW